MCYQLSIQWYPFSPSVAIVLVRLDPQSALSIGDEKPTSGRVFWRHIGRTNQTTGWFLQALDQSRCILAVTGMWASSSAVIPRRLRDTQFARERCSCARNATTMTASTTFRWIRRNSSAKALELRLSCTKTSICICLHKTYSNVFEFMEFKICELLRFTSNPGVGGYSLCKGDG